MNSTAPAVNAASSNLPTAAGREGRPDSHVPASSAIMREIDSLGAALAVLSGLSAALGAAERGGNLSGECFDDFVFALGECVLRAKEAAEATTIRLKAMQRAEWQAEHDAEARRQYQDAARELAEAERAERLPRRASTAAARKPRQASKGKAAARTGAAK